MSQTAKILNQQAQDKVETLMQAILTPAPQEITVQGIVDIICDYKEMHGDAHADDHLTVEITGKEISGRSLSIWDENGKETKNRISGITYPIPPMVTFRCRKNGKISMIQCEDELSRNLVTGNSGVEAKLYQMYCQGTIITDINECDVDELEIYLCYEE